jgi:hypothetical protein
MNSVVKHIIFVRQLPSAPRPRPATVHHLPVPTRARLLEAARLMRLEAVEANRRGRWAKAQALMDRAAVFQLEAQRSGGAK